MKIIRLKRLQIFNGVACHANEDHKVSDSIAELAAKRDVLDGPARDVPTEPTTEAVSAVVVIEAPAKKK